MLGALQWEVNESKGYSGILIPGAQAWLAGVWWPHPGSSPEPDRFLPGNNASRCVDLARSGQTRSRSKESAAAWAFTTAITPPDSKVPELKRMMANEDLR